MSHRLMIIFVHDVLGEDGEIDIIIDNTVLN